MTLSARSWLRGPDATTIAGRVRWRPASRLAAWTAARWRWPARGRALPAAVSAGLALERGERVLSLGQAGDGGCALVATDRALYHRGAADPAGPGEWSRLGWEQVARVGWDPAAGLLIVTGVATLAPFRTAIPLRRRGAIAEVARERVAHTRLGRWLVPAGGTQRVLIEVRRRPVTGELLWCAVPGGSEAGPAGADLAARLDRAAARLCADLGLAPEPRIDLALSPAAASPAP
jgi:hypothetical protein